MSQKNAIRRRLLAGDKISPLTALRDHGCMRLADVVFKLRQEGLPVETHTRTQQGKRFAVYKLAPEYLETLEADRARVIAPAGR